MQKKSSGEIKFSYPLAKAGDICYNDFTGK
jgi:hypothetical protein